MATEGGAKTAWVAIGDSFDGYEVAAFDPEESVLILRGQDGEEMRLGLAGAEVAEAKVGPALEEAAELLRSMKFEEMMAKSIEQQKGMMEKMFRQMGGQGGGPVNEEVLAAQMRFMEAFHEEMDWAGMQEGMVQAYGETFTRDELKGLIDFYSTPAGQAFTDKQGELMERTTELIQPRIMEAMAKLQPMMQEMQQSAAKAARAGGGNRSLEEACVGRVVRTSGLPSLTILLRIHDNLRELFAYSEPLGNLKSESK